jgi:hypothetical protein
MDYPPLDGRIRDAAAGADFTYNSSVKPVGNGRFILTNSITNNHGSSPLAVAWKDGGIYCVGQHQLPHSQTDFGKYTGRIIEYPGPVNARIRFGGRLQYPASSRVYVWPRATDPADPDADEQMSEFQRRRPDGSLSVHIAVVSRLDESRRRSELVFRVTGGLHLAIPMTLGSELKDRPEIKEAKTWKLAETGTVENFGLRDGSHRDLARDWLRTNDRVGYSYFVTLENLTTQPNELTFRLEATRWRTERVYVIGHDSERAGMIGLAVDVYVPNRAEEGPPR